MFLPRRPSDDEIASFLRRATESRLSYESAGLWDLSARGYKIDDHRARVGAGAEALERAKAALDAWVPLRLGWVEVHPTTASPEVGANVAILVQHLGFWSLNACRVVARFPSRAGDPRYGFAYGTLEDHAASGEEMFAVELEPRDDSIWYRIQAVSRPRAALAKLGYPISRRFQRRFRADSVEMMKDAVSGRHVR